MDPAYRPMQVDEEIVEVIKLADTIDEMVKVSLFHCRDTVNGSVVRYVRLPTPLFIYTRKAVHGAIARAIDYRWDVGTYSISELDGDPGFRMPGNWCWGWIRITVTARTTDL